MTNFKRSELRHFVNMREKSPPPVFVGRKAVIDDVLTIAATTAQERRGIPGNTTVIQGAPGAGKSSVLHQIESQSSRETEIRVVRASETDVTKHIPKVLQAIAFAGLATADGWREALLKYGQIWSSYLPIVSGFGVNVDFRPLFTSQVPTDISDLASKCPREKWTSAVILAVDEAQRLPTDKDRDHAVFLRNVHDADTFLPLTLVVAGLGDTHSVIHSLGLTHGIKPHSLGSLETKDIEELIPNWCQYFEIDIGSCRAKINTLMANTDGWPRFIHWAQQALAEALLDREVDGFMDKIKDWYWVHSRSNELRTGFYRAQFSNVMEYSPKLTGKILYDVALAQAKGEFLLPSQVRKNIQSYCQTDTTGEFECPPEYTYVEFVNHLVHCGALQKHPDINIDGMICPIPSFQKYIIARAGLEMPRTTNRTHSGEQFD